MEIKVPVLPESIAEGTVAKWYKKVGDPVKRDEHLVDIETDKVVLEVSAPDDGVLESILKAEGSTVKAQEVIGQFKAGSAPNAQAAAAAPKAEAAPAKGSAPVSPSVRKAIQESGVDISTIQGTGKDGRITTTDVEKAAKSKSPSPLVGEGARRADEGSIPTTPTLPTGRMEQRVPMSRIRARIAERLIQAQQSAAILTTFNEINMKPVMDIRQKYKETFEKVHGVRLGLMSFFTKAAAEALKRYPIINASVDGNDIIYHGYIDIGIAVSSPRGLVVPIIRDADTLSMAEIEKQILAFSEKAKNGKLTLEEMTGGTFTITNGGVFGSLMATPIINPPQSAILGMHKIEDRPVVENGTIVIRPMMYVALSYDHRIIDGVDSVKFLVTIKEILEDSSRILLDI